MVGHLTPTFYVKMYKRRAGQNMKIAVKEEHNFFLFQDLVEFFILVLKHRWRLPISNNYSGSKYPYYSASYYIYDSWYELVTEKVSKSEYTELGKALIDKFDPWMVTTNIAILTAQDHRKEKTISHWEHEYMMENKPYFLIELLDDYTTYVVHLDKEFTILFNEAVSFWKCFDGMDVETIYQQLSRYFILNEDIKNGLSIVCKHFTSNDEDKYISSYKIIEE